MSRLDHPYFADRLNYTIGDEDTSAELALLPHGADHVVAVAGSGGRALPLLARAPRQLTCIDVSVPQLRLTEVRLAALRAFELDEYRAFFGYPPREATPEERRALFARLELADDVRAWMRELLERNRWRPVIYTGQFERTLIAMSRAIGLLTGARGRELFALKTLADQQQFLATRFPRRRWRIAIRLLGNAAVMNALLYRGQLPRKNLDISESAFYEQAFDRLFSATLARESWFLQLLFLGRLRYAEGNPIECNPEVYARARAALGQTTVCVVRGDVLDFLARSPRPADFVSISDVPTFFPGDVEAAFLQSIAGAVTSGGMVVARGHLHVSYPDTRGYDDVTADFPDALRLEKTQMWDVRAWRRCGALA